MPESLSPVERQPAELIIVSSKFSEIFSEGETLTSGSINYLPYS